MTQEDRDEAIDALFEIASEVGGRVASDYSGRCMYGRTCYGIVCDPCEEEEVIEQAARRGLRRANVDSMGRQIIIYWPSIIGEEQ